MASVVFEKNIENIKKGLTLLEKMSSTLDTIVTQSQTALNINNGIEKINNANAELSETEKKLDNISTKSKKSFNFNPAAKSKTPSS